MSELVNIFCIILMCLSIILLLVGIASLIGLFICMVKDFFEDRNKEKIGFRDLEAIEPKGFRNPPKPPAKPKKPTGGLEIFRPIKPIKPRKRKVSKVNK